MEHANEQRRYSCVSLSRSKRERIEAERGEALGSTLAKSRQRPSDRPVQKRSQQTSTAAAVHGPTAARRDQPSDALYPPARAIGVVDRSIHRMATAAAADNATSGTSASENFPVASLMKPIT